MTDHLLDCLATLRVTKLITSDVILDGPREKLIQLAYERSGQGVDVPFVSWREQAITDGEQAPKLATLLVCPWCIGFWVSVFVVAARRFLPAWDYAARALAASAVTGLLAEREAK